MKIFSKREAHQAFVDEISHILWGMKIGERRVLETNGYPKTLTRANFVKMLEYRGWVDGNNCNVRKLSIHPVTGETYGRGSIWPLLIEKKARAKKYTKHKCNDEVKSLEVPLHE